MDLTCIASKLEPGTVLSDTYEIVRKIAKGGMGVVYEAKHLRLTGRRVAIKVLLAEVAQKKEVFARFRREAEICSKLGHPNIVSVTDWNILPDGMPFFVMEYLEGENLSTRMDRGDMSHREILNVVQQIGLALQAAHDQGVVHRDLKPSNVYLVKTSQISPEKPHVKVLDFGISKILPEATLQVEGPKILGSPKYMAPEQARGKNELIDHRADQFALALITYEMYAGKPAFNADTFEAILYQVINEPPQPLDELRPQIPERVLKAVEQAMNKAPKDRFESVAEFIEALIGEEGATVDQRPGTVAKKSSPQRRSLTRLLLGFLIGIAGVAIGLWIYQMLNKQTAIVVIDKPHEEVRLIEDAGISNDDPVKPERIVKRPVVEDNRPLLPTNSDAIAKIEQAKAHLAQKSYADVVRLVRQSIGVEDSQLARKLLALTYCKMVDLSNAKAAFFQVARKDRKEVAKACAEQGIELR